MKKKLTLDKELISAGVAATSLEGATPGSVGCPTAFYPGCLTYQLPMCNSLPQATCLAAQCPDPWE